MNSTEGSGGKCAAGNSDTIAPRREMFDCLIARSTFESLRFGASTGLTFFFFLVILSILPSRAKEVIFHMFTFVNLNPCPTITHYCDVHPLVFIPEGGGCPVVTLVHNS